MGDIPIVQGVEEFKHEILQNIFTVLKSIRYTPAEFSMTSDPSIDLGDMLTLKDVNSTNDSILTLVTSCTWSYHSTQKIKSDGGNTKLQGVSSSEDKQLSDMELRVESKKIVVHTFTNSSKIEVGDLKEEKLIVINYATVEDTKPIFMATIPLEMSLDGYVEFYIYVDGILDENGILTEYLNKGKHFVTFTRYFVDKADKRHTVTVTAKTVYVESDSRVSKANVATIFNYIAAAQADREKQSSTGEHTDSGTTTLDPIEYEVVPVDTTPPRAAIAKNDIKAVLYAQGLAGTQKWDGTINCNETILPIGVSGVGVIPMDESVTAELVPVAGNALHDVVSPVAVSGLSVLGISEAITMNEVVVNYLFNTTKRQKYSYNSKYVTDDDKFSLRTEYTFESTEQTIDSGRMCAVSIDVSDLASVQSIEVGVE